MRSDRTAFEDFAWAESPKLFRTAIFLVGDRGLAEDLVQDVLERLFVAWPRVDDPRAYSNRALINRVRNTQRRRRRRPESPLYDGVDVVEADRSGQALDRDLLLRALGALSARQRVAVVLRYYQDLSEAETAAVMGCSPGSVKSHAARGLSQLRAQLEVSRNGIVNRPGERSVK